MKKSRHEALSERRKRAGINLLQGEDFLDVAKEHNISPRTLLAWRNHEYAKWEGDPFEGREPGPSDDYDGEWPNEKEEMEAYAQMGLNPDRFLDESLRERYSFFLEQTAEKIDTSKTR